MFKIVNGGKMNALITGIDGFVGGYLLDLLLEKNINVYGTKLHSSYDNPKCKKVYTLNLSDTEMIKEILIETKPDYIFHLAGQSSVHHSWKSPALTITANVIGTINMLEAIKLYSKHSKILIVGSSDQYGIVTPDLCPIKETLENSPQSPYATSKKAQEEIALQYYKAYGLNILIARSFNHIGPNQREGFVIADFASQIASIEKKESNPILKVGNLQAKRDFTDVRDVVRAYYDIMTSGNIGEVYNVGSGNAYSIADLLDKMIALSTEPITIEADPSRMRPSDVPLIQCDNTKVYKDCGWKTTIPIEKTLLDTLNYWRLKKS